jgi:hypothetical protein
MARNPAAQPKDPSQVITNNTVHSAVAALSERSLNELSKPADEVRRKRGLWLVHLRAFLHG